MVVNILKNFAKFAAASHFCFPDNPYRTENRKPGKEAFEEWV